MILRRVARPMLASVFVFSGVNALRNPEQLAELAGPLVQKSKETLPAVSESLPDDTVTWVRINGAVQLGAGVMLAAGKFPRLASAGLAGSLVPTTVAGHDFWNESDPTARATQRTQFLKNVSLLGGLLIAAADTEGKPSVAWRGKHAVGAAVEKLPFDGAANDDRLSHLREAAVDRASQVADVARDRAPVVLDAARQHAAPLAEAAAQRGSKLADTATERLTPLVQDAAERGVEFSDKATEAGEKAVAIARKRADKAAAKARERAEVIAEQAGKRADEFAEQAGKRSAKAAKKASKRGDKAARKAIKIADKAASQAPAVADSARARGAEFAASTVTEGRTLPRRAAKRALVIAADRS